MQHDLRRKRWIPISLISLAAFFNYLDRGNLSVALPFVGRDLHLDPLKQGWALAAFSITYTLAQLPMGWLVDRCSLRWLYATAFALWCGASAATGLASGLLELMFFRLLLGIGEAIYLPGGLKLISEQFGSHERAVPSVVFDLGCKVGLAVGLVVEVWILHHFGWRWLFLSTGLIGLLWLVPWLVLYPTPPRGRRAPPLTPSMPALARTLRSRNAWGMAVGFFCWNYFWYLLVAWGPSWLYTARHVPLAWLGWVAGLLYAIVGCSEMAGGWLNQAMLRRGWTLGGTLKATIAVGFLLGLLLVPAGLSASRGLALTFLYGAALSGVCISGLLVVPQQCAPQGQVGSWVSFQNFIGNFPGIIGPIVTGWLIRRSGSFVPAFAISSVLCLGGMICYLWWLRIGSAEDDSRPLPNPSATFAEAPRG
jgi:MFS transporter, ACS family, D-galactonate transporter